MLAVYFSNVLIALAAAVLYFTAVGRVRQNDEDTWLGTAFFFCSTLLFYCLHDWYSKVRHPYSPQRPRAVFWQQHWSRLLVLPVLAGLLLPVLAWHWLTAFRLGIIGLFGAISLLYSLPLLPPRWQPRRYPLLKLLMLAGTWAALPVMATAADASAAINSGLIAQRSILLLLICLPFDWRDADHDRQAGARTLPDLLTIGQIQQVLGTLAVAHILMLALTPASSWHLIRLLISSLPTVAAWWLARTAVQRVQWPWGYLLLDSLLIVQPLLVGVLR